MLSDSQSWTTGWKNAQRLIISLNGKTPTPVSGYAMWTRTVMSYLSPAMIGSTATLTDIPFIGSNIPVKLMQMRETNPNPAVDTDVTNTVGTQLLSSIRVNSDGTLSLTSGRSYLLLNNSAYENILARYYLYIDYNSTTNSSRTATGMVYDGSGVDFFNNYTLKLKSLTVLKMVKGDLSDPLMPFDFNITLFTTNDTVDAVTYSYKIYTMMGNAPDPASDTVIEANGIIANGRGAFQLSHNQYLVISDIPEGEKYTITETGAGDYQTSIIAQNGTTAQVPITAKTAGEKIIVGGNSDSNNQYFINSKWSVPPTGILLEFWPYILAVLLVIGVAANMVMYHIHKKKRTGRSNKDEFTGSPDDGEGL